MLFLLYLVLPQTRGSSYIYANHLSPFFRSHEAQIDATLASVRAKIYAFFQARFRALWDSVSLASGLPREATLSREIDASTPPTLHDPASGPAQLISSLWSSYGPGIIAVGGALLRQTAAGATNFGQERLTELNTTSESRTGSGESLSEGKRRAEADSAMLTPEVLVPSASPAFGLPGGSSDSDVRRRERRNSNASGSRFEEIDVPSDIEGYDAGQDAGSGGRPSPAAGYSWFGWGGSVKSDNERVKKD